MSTFRAGVPWFQKICVYTGLAVCLAATACQKQGETTPPDDGPRLDDEDANLESRDPVESAASLIARDRADEALTLMEEALVKEPKNHELHFGRGVALEALGRTSEALQAWERAVGIEPGYFAALNGIGAVQLDAKKYPEAVEAFRVALVSKPDFADAHYNLGLALDGMGEPDKALQALAEARNLAPKDFDVLLAIADVELKRGNIDKAIAAATKAVDLAPEEASVHMAHGQLLIKAKKFPEAMAAFNQGLKLQPGAVDGEFGLARAQLMSGDAAGAQTKLEALAGKLPGQAVVWSLWGAALAKTGALDGEAGALAKFAKALELNPKLPGTHVRKVEALSQAGRCRQATAAVKAFRGAVGEATAAVEHAVDISRACKR